MDINFVNSRLERLLTSERNLQRRYGARMAVTIRRRLDVLRAARTLVEAALLQDLRLHQLVGNRDEQFAINLVHPYRLVFQLSNHPIPLREDGGVDTARVTAVTILEVVDYH